MYEVIVIVVVFLVIWIIIGEQMSPSHTTGAGNDCDACEKDREAYRSWKKAKQAAAAGWWALRWAACKQRGCF